MGSPKITNTDQLTGDDNELGCNSNTIEGSAKNTKYVARFFYNSAVRPRDIDNLLAKKSKNIFENSEILVKTRIF